MLQSGYLNGQKELLDLVGTLGGNYLRVADRVEAAMTPFHWNGLKGIHHERRYTKHLDDRTFNLPMHRSNDYYPKNSMTDV